MKNSASCAGLSGTVREVVEALCARLGLTPARALADLGSGKYGRAMLDRQCASVVELEDVDVRELGLAGAAFELKADARKHRLILYVHAYQDGAGNTVRYAAAATYGALRDRAGILCGKMGSWSSSDGRVGVRLEGDFGDHPADRE